MTNKEINFLPERITRSRKRKRNVTLFSLLFLFLLSALGWAVTFPVRVAADYQNRLTVVNQNIEELEPARPLYEKVQLLERELNTKKAGLSEIKKQDFKVTGLLRQINSILPADCYLTYLSVKKDNQLIIECVTHNPVETARIQVGLRKTGLFKEVSLADVGDVPLGDGAKPVTFTLELNK